MKNSSAGFSLVELSIVLVILGLLAGGVLTGQSLIRAAELRSVTTEYGRYSAAVNTFRDKYFALPGDMTNATSFWAAAANGNGDGLLSTDAAAVSTAGEKFGFWQQLGLAGLIEGSYSGLAGPASVTDMVVATNVPRSKVSNAGWSANYVGTQAITNLTYFEGDYNNVFYFGGPQSGGYTLNLILKPEEAWNIDSKIDDGKPAYGGARSFEFEGHATTGCSNPAAAATATAGAALYDLDNSAVACSLIFLMK